MGLGLLGSSKFDQSLVFWRVPAIAAVMQCMVEGSLSYVYRDGLWIQPKSPRSIGHMPSPKGEKALPWIDLLGQNSRAAQYCEKSSEKQHHDCKPTPTDTVASTLAIFKQKNWSSQPFGFSGVRCSCQRVPYSFKKFWGSKFRGCRANKDLTILCHTALFLL